MSDQIRYLTNDEIDRVRWDLCLEQSSNTLIYACSWYLDQMSPGWDALVLGAYEAVMPLTRKTKYFISYLYQPFFTQQLGVFSRKEITQELLRQFLEAIPRKFALIEINLNEKNQIIDEKIKTLRRRNYLLNLDRPYDKIQKDYDANTKRNIKKSRKYDLELKTIPYTDAVTFYKLHKGAITKGVKEVHYTQLLKMLRIAHEKKHVLSKGIYNKSGELLCTAIFLLYKNRIIFLIGTVSDMGREYGAMYYLFDYIILQFSHHQMLLDFEGSEIPGIARFFKGFGSEKTHYYRYRKNRLPVFLKWLKR